MDIGANNWNESDANNNTPAPDGAPEGMAPSGVDDTIRAMMGAIKRSYDWSIPKLTGGTNTAYTLAYSVAPGALVDGMTHIVQFNALNGTAPTLNVNGLGATALQYYSVGAWRAVPAGLFDVDTISRVAYNASAGAYRLLDVRGDTGELKPFAGATAPVGYLLCFGQAISRTAYAGLFTVIGTTYGAGDGSTTFNLPDLRGRVAAGKDDMGGSNANRLSSVIASTTLGAAGGQQTESAGLSGTASVSGSTGGSLSISGSGFLNGIAFSGNDSPGGAFFASSSGQGVTINSGATSGTLSVSASGSISGSTSSASNVPPTLILNQMIRI
jgi:microcystin-dependent protein